MQETLWLNNLPVATVQNGNLFNIHPDHLGTPRIITDANQQVIWRWESEPFGNTQPDEDPDGNGTGFTYNLRFPGQYYDQETGRHYNYFRDYDPATGRYVESDPIGLDGGLNGYAYVLNDPLAKMDETGLFGDGQKYPIFNPTAPLGHSNFAGAERFDFAAEDHDCNTQPVPSFGCAGAPENHFRPLGAVEMDINSAIQNCDTRRFERLMHQGQDFFSHYRKKYRWSPGALNFQSLGYGHAFDDAQPDNDTRAWNDANRWTKKWVAH